MCEQVVQQQ
jgi:hypothetical protein